MITANWSVDNWMDSCLEHIPKPVKTLIISSLRPEWSVIPVNAWPQVCDRESTYHVGFYPHEYDMHSYEKYNCSGLNLFPAADSILQIVKKITPQSIYLRVSPHSKSEHLIAGIKAEFPDLKICVEFYDMGIMFSRRYLIGEIGLSELEYEGMLAGSSVAFREADYLLTKSTGELWREIVANRKGASATYYPVISSENFPIVKKEEKLPIKVVYAGSVRAKELIDGPETTPGENFFKYFEIMAKSGQIEVDVFNAQHKKCSEDFSPNNALLMERYGNGTKAIKYHRALPMEELTLKLQEYDYGFACAHYEGDFVEGVSRAALGNRFMGYVEAGIPILVDSYFEAMAELVERFDAGIVIDPRDIEKVPSLLLSADRQKLKQGIIEMKKWMLQQNQFVIDELARFFVEK